MPKMQLWPGGDSGAVWPDGGGLLPQRESRQGRRNELVIHSFLRSAFLVILKTSKTRSFPFARSWLLELSHRCYGQDGIGVLEMRVKGEEVCQEESELKRDPY